MKEMYDDDFYDFLTEHNYTSAKKVAPVVYDIFKPESIVDFGCGVGCWLKAFSDLNSKIEILGIDGDWLSGKKIMIPNENVLLRDLEKNVVLEKKYDLAISLEVAEHLSAEHSDEFINNIVTASDVILFSAAIPQQGGTGHVNERWQSYWIEKMHLRGYVCLDFLRDLFWNDEDTGIYRQNIFVFVNEDKIHCYEETLRSKNLYPAEHRMIDVVHPMLYSEHKVARKFKELFEKKETENRKNRYLFELMIKWINKKTSGFKLVDYLKSRGICSVGIYGMGLVGEAVYNELKGETVIEFCTDRFLDYDIPEFIRYKDNIELPHVEAVIVTAPNDFDKIKNELRLRFLDEIPIVNIADILE